MAQHLPLQFLFAFIVAEYILSRRPSRVPWPSPLLGEMEIPKGIYLSIYLSPWDLHGCAPVAVMSPPAVLWQWQKDALHYTTPGQVMAKRWSPGRPLSLFAQLVLSVDALNVSTQQTQSSLELRTKFTGIQPFCGVVLEPLLSKQRMSSNFFPIL